MWSTVFVLTVSVLLARTSAQNDFDAILGCRQQSISQPAYNRPNPYYPIDQFRDVQTVEVPGLKVQTIKLAVMASNDGVIRLAPNDQPYQNTLMNEIVLSGWGNTINAVRQYIRSGPGRVSRNVIVVNQPSGRMLSPYKPFVFTLSIINDYMVLLTKVGESLPFLQYVNPAVQPKYIGFSNWNAPVSVFYDCPPPPPPPPPPTQEPPATTETPVPPPEVTTAPPPEVTTAPPPEVTTAPPPEITTAPPPEVTTAPPPEETTAPPPEVTTAPPSEVTTQEETTTPLQEETTAPEETTDPDESINITTELPTNPTGFGTGR